MLHNDAPYLFREAEYNMAPDTQELTDLQKEIFKNISNNEARELHILLASNKIKMEFVDENGMSPLQHACYKGNQEIVQMLLDQVRYVSSSPPHPILTKVLILYTDKELFAS